jgi:hypothetical protein
MKKIIILLTLVLMIGISACQKDKFAEYYKAPSTVDQTTVEKQFSGAIAATLDYTMYKYWNYFVVLQNTALHYTQAVSWVNFAKQYEPGAAAIGDRWSSFYGFVAQYKELLKVYSETSASDQTDKRIYIIAATIFYYDQTQKVVDLHGDIPWSEAGLLSTNSGDYNASYAKYDDASGIYTKMLDDLKGFSDELNSITISDPVAGAFQNQDFINNGNLDLWKKYCNSLRIRMLMRVSGVSSFQSRANSEIATILGNPSSYPVCVTNDDNIMIDVRTLSSSVSSNVYDGLIGWGNNDHANKGMIDNMVANGDPRLRAIFQPGALSAPVYLGLDPMMNEDLQAQYFEIDTIARYNYSTISKNKMLPGLLVTAAATQLLIADYYVNVAPNDAAAKVAYETGILASIDFYYYLRSISDNSETGVDPTNDTEKNAYLNSDMAWSKATTVADKNNIIATQKWINYSVLEPLESWAEVRRTNLPSFSFVVDNSSSLAPLPPARWTYPSNESTYNTANYDAVRANDNLSTKIFWDVN